MEETQAKLAQLNLEGNKKDEENKESQKPEQDLKTQVLEAAVQVFRILLLQQELTWDLKQKNLPWFLRDFLALQRESKPLDVKLDDFRQREKEENFEDLRSHLKALLTVFDANLPESTLALMDDILKKEGENAKLVDAFQLPRVSSKYPIAVWRGDITTLKVGGIVNAANKYMKGCFTPNHPCIDNVIHCKAGPRLRMKCSELMEAQQTLEETGKAKMTSGYSLPCQYVFHTVGPIIQRGQSPRPKELASSYRECLNVAKENGVRSIAFCCISTGVFGYPQEPAAHVACETVKKWLDDEDNKGAMDLVVFNVFLEKDHQIYNQITPQYFNN